MTLTQINRGHMDHINWWSNTQTDFRTSNTTKDYYQRFTWSPEACHA